MAVVVVAVVAAVVVAAAAVVAAALLDIMTAAERGRPPVENAGWPRRSQGRIMSTWSLVVNREVSHETL